MMLVAAAASVMQPSTSFIDVQPDVCLHVDPCDYGNFSYLNPCARNPMMSALKLPNFEVGERSNMFGPKIIRKPKSVMHAYVSAQVA